MSTRNKSLIVLLVSLFVSTFPVQGQARRPTSARRHFERARSYESQGDPRAESEYRQAIADRRGVYPEAWEWLSFYLAQKLRFDEAAASWRAYIKQSHQKARAVDLQRLHLLDRAAELKSRNDNQGKLSEDQMLELVHLIDQFGRKGDSNPYAERMVKLYPESVKGMIALADLIKWEHKDRALELLNRAVALEPTNPAGYTARGWCFFWAFGQARPAEANFRKALELSNESNASAWQGLGDSLARQGRREEAIVAYRRYLTVRPEYAAHYDSVIRQSIEELQRKP